MGQPELRATLAQAELRQLAQRITARYHLEALGPEVLKAMLCHRLAVAGALTQPFSTAAFRELHRQSGGIPRIANLIADRALLAGYGAGQAVVDGTQVKVAAREVRGKDFKVRRPRRGVALAALLLLSAAALLLALQARDDREDAPASMLEARETPPPASPEAPPPPPRRASAEGLGWNGSGALAKPRPRSAWLGLPRSSHPRPCLRGRRPPPCGNCWPRIAQRSWGSRRRSAGFSLPPRAARRSPSTPGRARLGRTDGTSKRNGTARPFCSGKSLPRRPRCEPSGSPNASQARATLAPGGSNGFKRIAALPWGEAHRGNGAGLERGRARNSRLTNPTQESP